MASKNLLIVESPAKAKTIEKYLGGDFSVKSSFGHIRDLPKKGLSIDKDRGFAPTYEVPADKKKVVSELKKAAKDAEHVWLASDEDREGEAIAWHLSKALSLKPAQTKRIVFHEITKKAIQEAIKRPRELDQNLVDAQQARRILDRLVGYELSPVLWKKVKTGLSAGRVQSVAVRLIVEREREIEQHKSSSNFKINALFKHELGEIKAETPKPLAEHEEAKQLIRSLDSTGFEISSIQKKSGARNPSPPFTTSSLQQEASTKLGYSVKQTMTLAQRLYENGHITYMRTDSTILSDEAISAAESYITKTYGDNYHTSRQYKTKSKGAQEAHEAIRPTDFNNTNAGADEQQKKLYQLVWKRALSSQMSPAAIERTELGILPTSKSLQSINFIAKGEILTFDGYQKVYGRGKEDTLLPDAKEGDPLDLTKLQAIENFARPPARYSEASLVKKLEELGIGRPSTYAPTISTIQTRGYVEKRDSEGVKRKVRNIVLEGTEIKKFESEENSGVERNKLISTHLADMTTDFLTKYFEPIVDYEFTARAEENFDKIAEGKQSWPTMIRDFYKDFHPLIEGSESVSRRETSKSRPIGEDPVSGKPIVARYGKFGPMLQKGDVEDTEKPAFAPMPQGATLDSVTLEQALEAFKLPREVGKTDDGQTITANIGRFGPYIQVGKLFVSIKPKDPMKISEAEAKQLYLEKLEKEKDKYIQQFSGGINIIKGPFGPYITDGKKNAKIPKDKDPKSVTEAEAKELLAKAPAKKRRFARRKS
jgi:DNA topoisomerase-1